MSDRHYCQKCNCYYNGRICPNSEQHDDIGYNKTIKEEQRGKSNFDNLLKGIEDNGFFKTPHEHILENYNNDYYVCKICRNLFSKGNNSGGN